MYCSTPELQPSGDIETTEVTGPISCSQSTPQNMPSYPKARGITDPTGSLYAWLFQGTRGREPNGSLFGFTPNQLKVKTPAFVLSGHPRQRVKDLVVAFLGYDRISCKLGLPYHSRGHPTLM